MRPGLGGHQIDHQLELRGLLLANQLDSNPRFRRRRFRHPV